MEDDEEDARKLQGKRKELQMRRLLKKHYASLRKRGKKQIEEVTEVVPAAVPKEDK